MWNKISEHKTARFIVLFFLLYGVLYGLNYVMTGLISPKGYYIAWLHYNADYISALRTFLLECAGLIVSALGYTPHLEGNILWVEGRSAIKIVYSCIGLNILCMWWAFIISYPMKIRKRIILFISGTFLIICLNVTRLTLLAMKIFPIKIPGLPIDHHDVYNIITYGIILLWMKLVIDGATLVEPNGEVLNLKARV